MDQPRNAQILLTKKNEKLLNPHYLGVQLGL